MPLRYFVLSVLLAFPSASSSAPVQLSVDASGIASRVIQVREIIPAEPGPLTLHYPKWIPARHRPVGQISNLANLTITAKDQSLTWKRDDADPFTIHLIVPPGASEVEVRFKLLLAAGSEGGAAFMTVASPKVMTMNWNDVLLYPKTAKPLALKYEADLQLPPNWKLGTALTPSARKGNGTTFNEVTLETLVDSPVLAGEHLLEVPIDDEREGHRVVIACDSPDGLEVPEATLKAWKRLPIEAAAVFGPAKPYERYTFLLGLSNHVPRAGIEHHQSSDNRLSELALVKATERRLSATLFPHEFVHSWNGKFRRPSDMIVADFQVPQQTRLLWVYEGLTNYLGWLLAARSGLLSEEDAREYLALTAARMTNSRGRAWRPLDDTAAAANVLFDAPRSWRSWRRAVDFYDEGTLLWLEVDVLIRTLTKGAKSLNDFCQLFHGGGEGKPTVKPYTLDDVITALNTIVTFDWKSHFNRRVQAIAEAPPLDGITSSGWKLTFSEKPSDLFTAVEGSSKGVDLSDSIGLVLAADGLVADALPDSPAAKVGLAPGMKLVAVNGRRYTSDGLKAAVAGTKTGGKLELLAESGDFFKTHALEYSGGARYPRLSPSSSDDKKGGMLSEILKPAGIADKK